MLRDWERERKVRPSRKKNRIKQRMTPVHHSPEPLMSSEHDCSIISNNRRFRTSLGWTKVKFKLTLSRHTNTCPRSCPHKVQELFINPLWEVWGEILCAKCRVRSLVGCVGWDPLWEVWGEILCGKCGVRSFVGSVGWDPLWEVWGEIPCGKCGVRSLVGSVGWDPLWEAWGEILCGKRGVRSLVGSVGWDPLWEVWGEILCGKCGVRSFVGSVGWDPLWEAWGEILCGKCGVRSAGYHQAQSYNSYYGSRQTLALLSDSILCLMRINTTLSSWNFCVSRFWQLFWGSKKTTLKKMMTVSILIICTKYILRFIIWVFVNKEKWQCIIFSWFT